MAQDGFLLDRHNILVFIIHRVRKKWSDEQIWIIIAECFWSQISLNVYGSMSTDCQKKQTNKYMIFKWIKRKRCLTWHVDAEIQFKCFSFHLIEWCLQRKEKLHVAEWPKKGQNCGEKTDITNWPNLEIIKSKQSKLGPKQSWHSDKWPKNLTKLRYLCGWLQDTEGLWGCLFVSFWFVEKKASK